MLVVFERDFSTKGSILRGDKLSVNIPPNLFSRLIKPYSIPVSFIAAITFSYRGALLQGFWSFFRVCWLAVSNRDEAFDALF